MNKTEWRSRRRMAIFSLFCLFFFTLCLFFFVKESKLQILNEASAWMYMAFTSIIGSYMGFKTLYSIKNPPKSPEPKDIE